MYVPDEGEVELMVAGSESDPGVSKPAGLLKAATGIAGLDEVTDGGLPRGRTTLVCGGPGCGKTLMAMQSLVLQRWVDEGLLRASF